MSNQLFSNKSLFFVGLVLMGGLGISSIDISTPHLPTLGASLFLIMSPLHVIIPLLAMALLCLFVLMQIFNPYSDEDEDD